MFTRRAPIICWVRRSSGTPGRQCASTPTSIWVSIGRVRRPEFGRCRGDKVSLGSWRGLPPVTPKVSRRPIRCLCSPSCAAGCRMTRVIAVAEQLMDRGEFDHIDIGVVITQITDGLPTPDEVEQVRAKLAAHGWPLDDPRYRGRIATLRARSPSRPARPRSRCWPPWRGIGRPGRTWPGARRSAGDRTADDRAADRRGDRRRHRAGGLDVRNHRDAQGCDADARRPDRQRVGQPRPARRSGHPGCSRCPPTTSPACRCWCAACWPARCRWRWTSRRVSTSPVTNGDSRIGLRPALRVAGGHPAGQRRCWTPPPRPRWPNWTRSSSAAVPRRGRCSRCGGRRGPGGAHVRLQRDLRGCVYDGVPWTASRSAWTTGPSRVRAASSSAGRPGQGLPEPSRSGSVCRAGLVSHRRPGHRRRGRPAQGAGPHR